MERLHRGWKRVDEGAEMSLENIIKRAQQTHGQSPPNPAAGTYPLDQIKHRKQDTRPLSEVHVIELAESISVLGLIEPLALDSSGRLLAGGHRLAAIQHIKAENPEVFGEKFPDGLIPARVFDFDAEEEPDLALQIEIAENEKRRDYTPTEVKAIADRLRASGFAELKGRPKKGQKALMPALSIVIGKSIRTVQNYLAESETGKPLHQPGDDKSTKHFVLLRTVQRALRQCHELPTSPQHEGWAKSLAALVADMESSLENEA